MTLKQDLLLPLTALAIAAMVYVAVFANLAGSL
jgi:hypothetical protein